MDVAGIAGLGAIAGFTIFLGLPLGRLRASAGGVRLALNAIAIGILVFLLWDILTGAITPVEATLEGAVEGEAGWIGFVGMAGILTAGLVVGLVGLAVYERWAGRGSRSNGPGAVADTALGPGRLVRTGPQRVALLIAIGIGLHNFAEGLAVGQSAAAGQMHLAVLLVIGFGLHNATEGFGIIGPLGGDIHRPGWGLLILYGLIGGGPTFVGTLVGQAVVSEPVSVLFLSLAAGSILYVVLQLTGQALRAGRALLVTTAVAGGLLLALGTELVLEAAGS